MSASIHVKRIYDDPAPGDGTRILVDRLWPRGVRKDAGLFDLWLKDVAPSSQLRQWFHQDENRFDVFRRRYLDELKASLAAGDESMQQLLAAAKHGTVTLVYAARNAEQNHALVLQDFIRHTLRR